MNYQPTDMLPVIAFEPYEETALARWRTEGLPKDSSPEEFLGMARMIKAPLSLGPRPVFEKEVFYEDDEIIIETDVNYGAKVKKLKSAPSMYYGFMEHQVKTKEDWKRIKYRYENRLETITGIDYDSIAAELNASGDPVKLELFPYFFRLGFYLMGMENFMISFYEQPDLIHEVFSFWNDLALKMTMPLMKKAKIDILVLAEDLAYNINPHISPEIYKEYWLPYQDLLVKQAMEHNISNICLWSAGDFDILIPMLMEHGINCIWPVERCSKNMDPVLLRKKYGKDLRMCGGVPKSCMLLGFDAIDREIEKLMPLVHEGGFIPALDDMVSPEVPWESYKHYVRKLQSIRL